MERAEIRAKVAAILSQVEQNQDRIEQMAATLTLSFGGKPSAPVKVLLDRMDNAVATARDVRDSIRAAARKLGPPE